jgi:hypothetical protein
MPQAKVAMNCILACKVIVALFCSCVKYLKLREGALYCGIFPQLRSAKHAYPIPFLLPGSGIAPPG